jgi:hypothetical protein
MREREEEAEEVGKKERWRLLEKFIQEAHSRRDSLQGWGDLLVGRLVKRRKGRGFLFAPHLGKKEATFFFTARKRGGGGSDKKNGFLPFLCHNRKKIGLSCRNEARYTQAFFLGSQSFEKSFEFFCVLKKIQTHRHIIQEVAPCWDDLINQIDHPLSKAFR